MRSDLERQLFDAGGLVVMNWLPRSMTLVLALTGACSDAVEPGAPPSSPAATPTAPSQQAAPSTGKDSSAPAQTAIAGATAALPTATASTPKTAISSAAGTAAVSTPPNAAGSGGLVAGTGGAPATAALGGAGARTATNTAGVGMGMQAAAGSSTNTGILPAPSALDKRGPFEILDQPDIGPGKQFRLFAPKPLGQDGLKHPIVAWSPGAGAFPDAYLTFLNMLASHGFVTLSYNSTAEGKNLVDAIDWLIAENEREGSDLYHKLDTTKIAAGGHSAGSLATYEMADDARLTTTLHMSGGSFNPSTDVPKLRKPALMVCGDAGGDGLTTGDLANPMCIADFEMAKVPVFFAVVKGAGHAALNDAEVTAGIGTEPDDPHKLLFVKATIGWLRWQLADDQSAKRLFVGNDCALCAPDSGYVVKQKNLN